MHYRGLKQASRQCLQDSGVGVRRLTLLFLLCVYAVTIPCDGVLWLLGDQLDRASGLGAAALRSRYEFWNPTLSLVINAVFALWSAGYAAFCLRLSRGQSVDFRTFAAGFRLAGKVLLLLLLETVYISLWAMLMVIPGVVAAYRYRVALFVLLDDPELSPSEAIAVSKRLTYGHKLELFTLDLTFFWYYLPAGLVTGLITAYSYGLLPGLAGRHGVLLLYLLNLLVPAAMDVLFRAYVTTTGAHAYNWLLSLDRARREAPWGDPAQ